MKTTDNEFHADDFVGSAVAFAHQLTGKQKLLCARRRCRCRSRSNHSSPRRSEIRNKLNVSQPGFAAMLNMPTVSAASWARGCRKPTGAALWLLDIAHKHPGVSAAG